MLHGPNKILCCDTKHILCRINGLKGIKIRLNKIKMMETFSLAIMRRKNQLQYTSMTGKRLSEAKNPFIFTQISHIMSLNDATQTEKNQHKTFRYLKANFIQKRAKK